MFEWTINYLIKSIAVIKERAFYHIFFAQYVTKYLKTCACCKLIGWLWRVLFNKILNESFYPLYLPIDNETNDETTVQSSLFINIFVTTQDSVFFQTCAMQSIQSNGPLPYYNKWSLSQTNLKCHKFISYTFSFVITDNKACSYKLILPVKNQTDIFKSIHAFYHIYGI